MTEWTGPKIRSGSPKAPWVVVTGLDGAGKTMLVQSLSENQRAIRFRLPYHDFIKSGLFRSGNGEPCGDVLTDRLLFAVDARLTNYSIAEWRQAEHILISQRGWMDNYIFGAGQGVNWAETTAMLHPSDLEKPSAIIYLVANPDVAFERIRQDPPRDKYETLSFMRIQYSETRRFFDAVEAGDRALEAFLGIPSLWIDTTSITPHDVRAAADAFLTSALPSVPD
jgi:thymidylate kinase